MPEMKNSFQRGRMNKDLDERIVPQGEYRDALNVEVNTSESSNIGTLQTIKGNAFLAGQGWATTGTCIGSIANDRTDKLYFMIAGNQHDIIIEYDQKTTLFAPVCVDAHFGGGSKSLNFLKQFLITGVNIIDDTIYWTDNNSEPKRINITRGKEGSKTAGIGDYLTTTRVVIKDTTNPSVFIDVLDELGAQVPILEKHLTVIKLPPPAAPVLEMVDTERIDEDLDGDIGGTEISRIMTLDPINPEWLDANGDFFPTLVIDVGFDADGDGTGADFAVGDYLIVHAVDDPSIKVRLVIQSIGAVPTYTCMFMAGDQDITGFNEYVVTLVQRSALFEFKLPRFACRYKYTDGEYSTFSSFTEPAFLPGNYNYMSKEGYNLGMVNRVRKLAIKNFVHTRKLPEDVVAIDILYKESNSPNIYSVKTIKNRIYDPLKWDEWNAISIDKVVSGPTPTPISSTGWLNKTKGYLPITSEMIHAVLPANQLLRPWDNVPRQALAQEVVGNRLVYGNYLQNYNLSNSDIFPQEHNIKLDISIDIRSYEIGTTMPEEIRAPMGGFWGNLKGYAPAKSLKTLRTYQLGVVYIDQYGRETPVFSEDKIGVSNTSTNTTSTASVYNQKINSSLRNNLTGTLRNHPPDWATHFKYFVKETSNEYYNLAMDRWYDAEDGNIWLSFPSAERNKVDEETFIILKKEHDNNVAVTERARYKILAIDNEAPRFIKLTNTIIGVVKDDGVGGVLGHAGAGFPLVGEVAITITLLDFVNAGLDKSLLDKGVTNTFLRVSTSTGVSRYYPIRSVALDGAFYRITVKEEFKEDMSITSADNTIATAVLTCEVTIVRKEEQDKAEFDGRFFAKILKDVTLIDRLGVNLAPSIKFKTSSAMKVQLISPTAPQVSSAADFFGNNKYALSVDSKSYWSSSAGTGGAQSLTGTASVPGFGDGPEYWQHAADDSSFIGSDSSGWFIDKVEGFRPWKGHPETNVGSGHNGRVANFKWNPHNPGFGTSWASGYEQDVIDGNFSLLNVHNINAYSVAGSVSGGGGAYLGMSDLNTGDEMNTGSPASGQGIAKPVGILASSSTSPSTINISYAGTNNSVGASGDYTVATLSALTNHYFNTASVISHVEDVAFITKLTAPNTLWRWKEDPGGVIYKTISPVGLTPISTPYTQAQWDNEQTDIDGDKGALLFNYAVFADYVIKPHHTATRYANCLGTTYNFTDVKAGWVSRDFSGCSFASGLACAALTPIGFAALWAVLGPQYSPIKHAGQQGAKRHANANAVIDALVNFGEHKRFPQGAYDWDKQRNKRRRFVFMAESSDAQGQTPGIAVGSYAPHFYSPTNDPMLPAHHDAFAQPIEDDPLTGLPWLPAEIAPGIRPDGMYTGHLDPDGGYSWMGPGGLTSGDKIPQYKRWGTDNITNLDRVPGSVTWEILEPFVEDADGSSKFSSTNPAIWETEPKEDVGLDIYHEVGQVYPINLNDETIEQFVGAIGEDVTKNSYVQCWDPPYVSVPGATATGLTISIQATNTDMRVSAAYDRYVQLSSSDGTVLDSTLGHTPPTLGAFLIFHRADGSTTEAHVASIWNDTGVGDWYELSGNITNGDVGVHNKMVTLPWFNCYSFGNGVESDRIRDDYNQITIDNGPKVSTTIEGQYTEDRRENGFIWSGIYNSTSGINNLNQFIQAEAITKDVNPGYGSIQKMSVRDSDLVAFCEDRVLKVLADKDALFNADGNTNVVATNRVLGSVKPFIGDYGISKNPESFAKDSYRSYFSDTSRGVIVRLSMDGLTPISDAGMKDWFADNLPGYIDNEKKIIGSFDDKKQEYNITLNPDWVGSVSVSPLTPPASPPEEGITISYSEPAKGWVSFKSFIKENGISLNNNYYTFNGGQMYKHHANSVRNNFYGVQFDSSVDTLFNQQPGVIKSFSTINYEGSQSKITQDTINNPDYYDNIVKDGWYIQEIISNAQELGSMEFWDKEDKWFSQIKGVTTEWLNDGTAGNIDPREFSYQGIGNAGEVSCPTCPPTNPTWDCLPSSPAVPGVPAVPGIPGTPLIPSYTTSGGSNCSSLTFDGGYGVPFATATEGENYLVDLTAGSGVDVSAVTIDIDASFWSATPPLGLLSADICQGSVPGTHAAYFVGAPYTGGPGSGNIGVLASLPPLGTMPLVNCGNPGAFGNVVPAGMNPNGYASYDDLLADTIIQYPGAGITTSTTAVNWGILMGIFHGNTPGFTDVSQFTICYPQARPCECTNVVVPAVPAVAAIPPIPAIPAIPAVVGGCTMVVGGLYPTFAACDDVCNIPPSFNCVTANSLTPPYLPISYCIDPLDGTGTYATNVNCVANCATPPPPPSWECDSQSGVCFDPGNGSGPFASLSACSASCIAPSWDCDTATGSCFNPGTGLGAYASFSACTSACAAVPNVSFDCITPGNCVDPGTGLGTYSSLILCNASCLPPPPPASWHCLFGMCVDPGDGTGAYTSFSDCTANCGAIMVGPCNIQNGVAWDATTSWPPGSIVSYSSVWYYSIASANTVGTPPIGATTSILYWQACLPPTTSGSCSLTNATEWDLNVQHHTALNQYGTFGYSEDDVVSVTFPNGFVSYYYSLFDVPSTSTFVPSGLNFNPLPGPFGQASPWMDCSGGPITTFGSWDGMGNTPCDISNYEVWDPTFDYQVGIFDNSPLGDGNWAVAHNGTFWILGCMQSTASINLGAGYLGGYLNNTSGVNGYSWNQPNPWGYGDSSSGTTVLGNDGTTGDVDLPNGVGDAIEDAQEDCHGFSGLVSQAGIEPGAPYSPWFPCIVNTVAVSSPTGCCDDNLSQTINFQSYGAQAMVCFNDPSCTCDPTLCM